MMVLIIDFIIWLGIGVFAMWVGDPKAFDYILGIVSWIVCVVILCRFVYSRRRKYYAYNEE